MGLFNLRPDIGLSVSEGDHSVRGTNVDATV